MKSNLYTDIIKYAPSKAIPALFSIVIIPILTNWLDPNEYGQYILVSTTVSFINILAVDWLATSIIRYYAEHEQRSSINVFIGTILRCTIYSIILVAILYCAILLSIRKTLPDLMFRYFMLGLLLFIIGAFYHIMLQLLIVQEKPYSYSVFSIYSSSITLLVGVILAKYLNLRITGLFIGYIGSLAIGLPILFNFSIARYKCRTFLSSMSAEMLRYGLPLVATNISNWVLRLSDRYIIEFYKGSHEVGLYSISYTVAEGSIQILITLIFLSSAPKAMKIWESEGAESARCYITRLTRSFLILVIPATIGLALLAKPILMILSNVKYIEGHAIMPSISVSMLVFGLQRNFQLGLLFHKKTRLIMYSLICSALINIVLNFIFVPRFGFIAAGYTTLSSYIAMSVMIATLSRSYFVWKFPFRTLSRVLISTACMAIVIILGSRYIKVEYGMIQLVIIILGAIVSYFGMLLLMRELKIDVLMRAKKIIQRDEE